VERQQHRPAGEGVPAAGAPQLEEGHGTRYPDMASEPKRLFDTLAASYASLRTRSAEGPAQSLGSDATW
jgi:hypothetical protein